MSKQGISRWRGEDGIIAVGIASPYFYTFKFLENGDTYCIYTWEPAFDHKTAEKRYRTVLCIIVILIPFLLLTFFYSCIIIALRRQSASPERQYRVQRIQRERENSRATRTAVAIVVAFTICFGPTYAFNIIQLFLSNAVKVDITSCSTNLFFEIVKMLVCLNGALNPLICFVFLQGYRRSLKLLFRCCSLGSHRGRPESETIVLHIL